MNTFLEDIFMKIAICGDISITTTSWQAFENVDVKTAFCDVADFFTTCDRVLVNLECAVTDRGVKIKKYGPNLNAPLNTVKTLKAAGVTDCMLSNNHIFDWGREGVADTFKALRESDMAWAGFGENYEDSRKNHIIEKDGVKIAVVDVCEHEYTYALENRMGARPFDEFETMDDIRKAKKEADVVIVIYHGGKEYCRYPSPRLLKACREMVRCGADAVFCQHSHCIGCYEFFEGGHILYGQGNFHFVGFEGQKGDEMWNTGLMAVLDIDPESKKIDVEFIPVTKAENEQGIELAKGDLQRRLLLEFAARNAELASGEWKKGWHDFCVSKYNTYIKGAARPTLESDLDDMQLFCHYLDCEAHTDVWRELFYTWNHTNEMD